MEEKDESVEKVGSKKELNVAGIVMLAMFVIWVLAQFGVFKTKSTPKVPINSTEIKEELKEDVEGFYDEIKEKEKDPDYNLFEYVMGS